MNKYLEEIKNIFKKIINFYADPYSDISLNFQNETKEEKQNTPKKKKGKSTKEITGETTIQIFINYYKKNTANVFIQVFISVALLIGIAIALVLMFKLSIFTQLWYIILLSTAIGYSVIKPGLYYLFERKKEITLGLFSLIGDYIENSTNVSFKNYIENIDSSRYPKLFIEEFLNPMIKTMQTTYSEEALKQELNLPRNNYYEIEKYKDFIIKAIASNDQSIRKALKIAIETSKESKKAYIDKMKSTGFIVYIAIGFAMIFPAIFMFIFSTTLAGVGISGITSASILPSALTFNLWFLTIVLSSTAMLIGFRYYMGEEGKAVIYGQYVLIGLTITSIIIYALLMIL